MKENREREPELFVPDRPGVILNQAQIGAVRGSVPERPVDGGIVNHFHGPIYDHLDVDIIDNMQERRLQRKALVG